jgi:hypothetical protein
LKATIENFVGIYEDAFPLDYCNDVIKIFNQMQEQGFTKNRQELEMGDKTFKDDDAIWTGEFYRHDADLSGMHNAVGQKFNEVYWNECYKHYAEHFAPLKESGPHGVWGNKVQKTGIGQGYHVWHYESGNRENCNRLLTHIVYLNDVEEGGETEMLYFHKRFKPKAGTMLIFPAAFTHTHRGNPPLSNEKYIITGWTEF